jgi:diketogulonate reductase-like aldo/keto reductase
MNTVVFPSGRSVPKLGLGTWQMGESTASREKEVGAVRYALEVGYRLIDTAEMYGEGGAEEIVGEALASSIGAGPVARDDVFVVSKVYPHNASRTGVLAACERSRRRLRLEWIDLYLLHWRGAYPLEETVAAFETLVARGHVRQWGVSNFDRADLEALWAVEAGGRCATNQVWYSISQRGPEFDVLPFLAERAMPLMAYSPIDQGRLAHEPLLRRLADARGISPAVLALAWVTSRPGVIAIPKAVSRAHLRENLDAARLVLSTDELSRIDSAFPAPRVKTPLAML